MAVPISLHDKWNKEVLQLKDELESKIEKVESGQYEIRDLVVWMSEWRRRAVELEIDAGTVKFTGIPPKQVILDVLNSWHVELLSNEISFQPKA